MFSVIIPVYNKEQYIKRSVNSVLNQSFSDFELIIIDDASTDNSLHITKEISDKRIKIIERKIRGYGGYTARNIGINEAKTKYVSFLDADDEWNTDYLKTIHDLIQKYPECNVFSTAWIEKKGIISKTNSYFNTVSEKGEHIVNNFFKTSSEGKNPICTITITSKKDTMLKIGGFPEGKCKRGGDIETWMRLMLNNKLAWSPYIGAVYYKDISNTVTKSISDIEIPYIFISSKNYLTEKNAFFIKKYANYYCKMSILHAIVFNRNKKEIIKGFYKEVDKKYYYFFKILMIFPSFILRPLFRIYRKGMQVFSKGHSYKPRVQGFLKFQNQSSECFRNEGFKILK